MKNEIILKYLDNQLSETEKRKFEKELSQNKELWSEYQTIREKMENLKRISQIRANSGYFDTLNEKLTAQITIEKKPKLLTPQIVSLTSLVVVLFVLFIYLFQGNSTELIEFTDSDIEVISKYESRSLINERIFFANEYSFFSELNLDEVQDYYYENFISDSSAIVGYGYNNLTDYSYLEEIEIVSDKEFTDLLSELDNIQIL